MAEPMGWGRFTYAYKQNPEVTHSPGGGGIAVRPTDVARFGYLLLREGRWNDRQLVPAEYVRQCGRKSAYNPHYPYSLQFNVNTDGRFPTLPRDMYPTSRAPGVMCSGLSLRWTWWFGDWRGAMTSHDEANTGVPLRPEILKAAESRRDWKSTMSRSAAEQQIIAKVIEAVAAPGENSR